MRDPSPTATLKVQPDPLWPEVAIESTVATMCASCVIQAEVSGVTYVETATTSIGQVALTYAPPAVQSPQLIIGCH